MLNFIKSHKKLIVISFLFLFLSTTSFGIYFFKLSSELPSISDLKSYNYKIPTMIYDRNGKTVAELGLERRIPVTLDKIPMKLRQAVVAVEDGRFYEHKGVDLWGIMRAFLSNIKAGKVVEGGSTLTQQLVKIIYLTPEKKLKRKVKEAILAYKIDNYLTKDKILEIYMNEVYYGRGSYGVEMASQNYFGKHVWELTLSECAMLAGIPKAPGIYAPHINFDKSVTRMKHVLSRMNEEGYISNDELKNAVPPQVIVLSDFSAKKNFAGYFVDYITPKIKEFSKLADLTDKGYKIYTTLDIDFQERADEAVRKNLFELSKRQGYFGVIGNEYDPKIKELLKRYSYLADFNIFIGRVTNVEQVNASVDIAGKSIQLKLSDSRWAFPFGGSLRQLDDFRKIMKNGDYILAAKNGDSYQLAQEPKAEGSLLAINPKDGEILAMTGGFDYRKSYFNRAFQAKRQVGSLFKPFVYTAAIDNGYNGTTLVFDAPILLESGEQGKYWKPQNFDEEFYGFTTIKDALTKSRNVVTIKLAEKIGLKTVKKYAKQFGIETELANDLSISIGSSSISLLEMVYAYSVFPNIGKLAKPVAITKIVDNIGNMVYQSKTGDFEEVIKPSSAQIVLDILGNVIEDGTAQRAKYISRPVAGKTGTTNEYKDAWFIGFMPNLIVGTWVGFDDFKTLGRGETGGKAALPAWLFFVDGIINKLPYDVYPSSPDVFYYKVDSSTNKITDSYTEGYSFEPFRENPNEGHVIR